MPTPFSQIEVITVDINSIEIGDRFRKDLGDIKRIASSIKSKGLIQPIAVCKNDGNEKQPWKLVAGGRRTAAIQHLIKKDKFDAEVSARVYDKNLTELQLRSIEYAENMYRKDLTWNEEVDLRAKIHELQERIHGKKTSTAKNAPGISIRDTANMLGISKGQLSEDLRLASLLKDLPGADLSKVKTKQDMVKLVKHAKDGAKRSMEAKDAIKRLGTGESFKKRMVDSYHIEDFFDGIKKIGDATMDLVEIDPPYSIDLTHQKKDYQYTGYNEVNPDMYPDFMQNTFKECYRVMRNNAWLLCWFGPDPWFEPMYKWLTKAGFRTSRLTAIWVKGTGQTNNPEYVLANSYEHFYYARKNHPTERPIEMMEDILTTFAIPNANVLVPYAGGGNTLIAAAKQKMIPIGFDLSEEYKEGYIIKIHKEFKDE